MMKPRLIIRTGIAASAIAHLSAFMLVLLYTEVHPFGSVTAEQITVDIVTPAEAMPPPPMKEEPPQQPAAKPADAFDLPSKSAAPSAPPPAPPQAALPAPAAPAQP